MNILKLTDKPAELEAVKDKVLEELQYLRSLDTAGDGGHPLRHTHMHIKKGKINAWHFSPPDVFLFPCLLDINVIKNQINSLLFVKKVCETRIQRLQSGKVRNYRTPCLYWRSQKKNTLVKFVLVWLILIFAYLC